MENINRSNSKSPPIFVMAGTVMIRVSKITLMPFAFLINLKILIILRARMKVVEEPKSTFIVKETIVETMDERTITKSKIFPVSRK